MESGPDNQGMNSHKYARTERERRFLVATPVSFVKPERVRLFEDRYIAGTTLRLRRVLERGKLPLFKLTQKLLHRGPLLQENLVTTMYISQQEFCLLAALPSRQLQKKRISIAPFCIDVFQGELKGLILAEVELSADNGNSTLPAFLGKEVSADGRFNGAHLAQSTRGELSSWLAEYQYDIDAVSSGWLPGSLPETAGI